NRDLIGNEIDRKETELKILKQHTLDKHLPEVFAIVKDTCRRLMGHNYEVRNEEAVWNMIPFDVQLIGGVVLHNGMIAEMATGEGKTLVATMPLFLNALLGKGVHLITVNDYLAQRDSEWMSPIFEFHGFTIGCNINGMSPAQKHEVYNMDVTYGTNSEFGFDYLRDNMATTVDRLTQKNHQFSIVDEVDSVLIDEARTPLIISGPVQESKNFYNDFKPIIAKLVTTQNAMINRLLNEVKQLIADDNSDMDELGKKLLLIKRGSPKNKNFLKLMKDGEVKKLVDDYEGYYIRDKNMHELDAELFYAIEERQNSVDLSEKGNDFVAGDDPDLFIMEELDEILETINSDDALSFQEKTEKKEEATNKFLDKNEKLHNIKQLLKSYILFEKEVDYVVVDNKVNIVDVFTGRMMPGRRFSDGLHQALEAKENVKIEEATQTYATITLQNYFRMYDKLAGMTGTAVTEEAEFQEIYNLSVVEIPTNVPISRNDNEDVIYLTKNEKYKAIIDEIRHWHGLNKPVLVGTVTVEVSETLSRLLRRTGIKHNVLNAKYHQQEAEIIKNAGTPGSVTIATNMAGRGTDIKLGEGVISRPKAEYLELDSSISEENPFGNPCDGLHVIGTERHESRRIDCQLRGRAGRQGDPGTSRFYLSLEDDLMRLFAPDRLAPMMTKMGLKNGDAIVHPWMTSAVGKAQKRVESYNFEIRKQLLKYDEVMNQQREVIYKYRRNVLKGYNLNNEILDMISDTIEDMVYDIVENEQYPENWDFAAIVEWLRTNINVVIEEKDIITDHPKPDSLVLNVQEMVLESYTKREEELSSQQMREIERRVLMSVVDELWRDHLHEMDLLKEGIGLRAYAQKDPLIEYKKESFILFKDLILNINRNVAKKVFTTYIISPENIEEFLKMANQSHAETSAFSGRGSSQPQNISANSAERPKLQPRQVE
ncbi:MAG: preprotein translocase subunit SecA, partial [Candidatus Cloacimonetes bacterium]|nr:preprotein translocase subunit SecA [Candidatus Cloacimonadota bacterium]